MWFAGFDRKKGVGDALQCAPSSQKSPLAMSGSGRMFMRFWGITCGVKLFIMQRSSKRFARSVATSEGGFELPGGGPTIRIAKVFSDLLSLAEAPIVIAIDLLGLLDAAVAGRRRLRG